MENKKSQIRKKILYLIMAICIMVVVRPEYVKASGNYTADWQRWSQGASGYSAMQYGCRVTAYSKMLAEAGYTGFGNPDGFFEWGKGMGYFRASDTCELTSIGTAPVTYVNNNGGTASLAGRQALSGNKTTDADTIMNLIKQGYYVILTCSEHTAYVGREASLNQGTAVLLDSWASKAEGPSLQYKSYTLYTFQTANYFRITSSASVQLWGIYENDTFSGQAKFWAKRGDSDPNHYAIWYMDDVPLTGHTNSDSSGFFSVNVDTTKYSNGTHQLSIYYANTGAGYWDVRHINISNPILLWGIYENDTFSGQVQLRAKREDSDPNHYAIWYMDDVPLTGHTNSDSNGFFSVNIDTTKYSNGMHQLSIHYVNTGADYWDVRHININNDIHIHSYTESVTKQPTCTQTGLKTFICSSCNDSYTEEIPMISHSNFQIRDTKEATCQETGYTGNTYCSICNTKVETGSIIQKKEHIWDEGEVKLEADCTTSGFETYNCTICHAVQTKIIPEFGHITEIRNAVPATTIEEGYTGDTYCTRCGQKIRNGIKIEKINETPETVYPEKGVVHTTNGISYKVSKSGESDGTVEIVLSENKSVKSIKVPDVVMIDGYSFRVTAVANGALSGCKKLKTVELGKNITSVGDKAFYNCTALTTVSASGVKEIGSSAFYGCKKLETVKGLDAVTSIGSKAFYKCEKLATVGSKSKAVTLKNVKTIGSSAFYGCKAVKKVNLTSTALTKIGDSAFQGCTSMTSFTSKSTKLTSIGKKAFYGDRKLGTISLKTEKLKKAKVGSNAFKGIKSTCKFKVPKKKVSTYKTIFKAKGAGSKLKVSKL